MKRIERTLQRKPWRIRIHSPIETILPVFLMATVSFVGHTQNVNRDVLNRLKVRALETHSDAIIIKQGDNILYKDFFGKTEKPVYIASAGKSLTSLAIGKLLEKKLLDSLDQPVYTVFPEWNQGRKKLITIRMLLNHTSGLQNNPNASVELEPPPDYQIGNIIKLALAAELSAEPGSEVNYNNKAVALLGGIVQQLTGKTFDQFFIEAFYDPMNISEFGWIKDRSGNPTVHGAFKLKATDLLKFGELLLHQGTYNGERIVEEAWIHSSLEQGQPFTPIWGLLWWRLPRYEKRIIDDDLWRQWENKGVSESFLERLTPVKNVLFESKEAFFAALKKQLGDGWSSMFNEHIPPDVNWSTNIYSDDIVAYYANGFRGNYLVVVPSANIVAVRLADSEDFDYDTDFFSDFVRLVSLLDE